MNDRFLKVVRIICWTVAVGAVVAVIVRYDMLADMLPVTRWREASKSPLVALRVPLINVLTLGLVELLSRGLRRVREFHRADAVTTTLFLTAAAKAVIEALEILRHPASSAWTFRTLAVVIAVGIGVALFFGRELFDSSRWREMQLTRMETTVACALLATIALLNLPLLFSSG